jgi:hypothetical protein
MSSEEIPDYPSRKFTVILDEDCQSLLLDLRAAGLKVIPIEFGTPDPQVKELAENCAIVARTRVDLWKKDAIRCDYDLIDVSGLDLSEPGLDTAKLAAQKVVSAVQRSGLAGLRGNFHLTVALDCFTLDEILN